MSVVVVDYGSGNVFSVCRALEVVGASPQLSGDPEIVASANMLILPGVGSFQSVKARLLEAGLHEAIGRFLQHERPFLGICVGMQLLFDYSEEHGRSEGWGIIPGAVTKIPTHSVDGKTRRVPFIGWTDVSPGNASQGASWSAALLGAHGQARPSYYFVHSFAAVPKFKDDIFAVTDYDGFQITAAVKRDHVFGVQFHPERSGPDGLRVLSAFAHQA
jgi:imidazole glycerol-phosphate synthase subunit HisH